MQESRVTLVLDSLKAGQDLFKGSASTALAATLPGREQVQEVLEKVRTDASKVGILCGDGPGPSSLEAESLAESLVQSCLGLAYTMHCLTSGAGPSLQAALQATVTGILGTAGDLVKAMAHPGSPAIKSVVGLLWGALDAAARSPLDNRACIFKHITTVLLSMKDGVREMTELQEEGSTALAAVEEEEEEEARGGAAAQAPRPNGVLSAAASANGTAAQAGTDEGGSGGDDDMFDFATGKLGDAEVRTLASAKELVEAAGKVLRAVSKPLLQGPAVTPESGLEGWENVLWHARMLQRCCEDLGAAMYPPQDLDEVRGSSDGLYNTAGLMLQEIPEVCAEQLADEVTALEQQLETCYQGMQAALAAAEAVQL